MPDNRAQFSYEMEQRKLYHLIWQRAMASQMIPVKYEVTKLEIVNNMDETDNLFVSKYLLHSLSYDDLWQHYI